MKNKINIYRFWLIMNFLAIGVNLSAQNKPDIQNVQIETRDGNLYTGVILKSDSIKVLFLSDKLGEITLSQKDITRTTLLDSKQIKNGKYWSENPQSTRYFFSPNGYGLKKGEGYYQNIWVLMNSFAVGVNDYISIGGGMMPLFLFGEVTPVWITGKVSIPVVKEKFNLGAGFLTGTALGAADTGFGIFYGIATLGSKDYNASIGMGYGFSADSGTSSPMWNLNGMARIGPRGYLITENYLFVNENTTTVLISLGGRTIIKGAGLDYGLIFPSGSEGEFIAIPWLGITIPFGNHK